MNCIQSPILSRIWKYSANIYTFACNCITNDTIFASNKTHHASHLNSAPGWVFDFYRGLFCAALTAKTPIA